MAPRKVQLGERDVLFPSPELQILEPCNHLLEDVTALHKQMQQKGYLYIQGLHDREEVLVARRAVLAHLDALGDKLHAQHPMEEGVVREGCGLGCLPFMEGRNVISHNPDVLKVLEGPRPFAFFKKFFDAEAATFDFKWLRAMHREGYTGAHVDNVYMSRGSAKLLTMWTPLGDIPVEMGVLAVCEGSNSLPGFRRFQDTYGNTDLEAKNVKGTGWFTLDPLEVTQKFGGQWKTIDFKAGDVLIFNMRTVHMSTANNTHFARISCDTRWQPAEDALDPRFNGNFQKSDAKFGLQSQVGDSSDTTEEEDFTTIEALRQEWGL